MGRPPSNGGPSFRFMQYEVTEMDAILQEHHNMMPAREVLVSLAEKFSESPERKGKIQVQMKQVWNWFQNRRYAIRAKSNKAPMKLNITPMPRDDSAAARSVPQQVAAPIPDAVPATTSASSDVPFHTSDFCSLLSCLSISSRIFCLLHFPIPLSAARSVYRYQKETENGVYAVQFSEENNCIVATEKLTAGARRATSENSYMEFEAKSGRDGAWYDVGTFQSHRYLDKGDPEVLVRFAGFGPDEDEWLNVCKHVRQRSLPCEASECVAVLPGDLILCFQEGKDQALYFDAHVLDAQRRRHDVRGCRCRFLVRYDHDQSEEIVPLRKICRRPETDYRLLQLHAANDSAASDQQKTSVDPSIASTLRVAASATETMLQQQHNTGVAATVSQANVSQPAKTIIAEPKEAATLSAVDSGNPSFISTAVLASGMATSSGPGGSGENMQGIKL
ncbi:hypothetical protein POTOM_002883 [Populus tomentosa]|uniref:Homeobox domain-containing protein n=1 Tax=Populus tomentosa TaxID=118781 RepID=A0A8X8IZM3_POPTO|nr:hypothetical protein POTOM_002883 [Populus tomentosa]